MLDCLPIYHWFHCGNPYSGAQGTLYRLQNKLKNRW